MAASVDPQPIHVLYLIDGLGPGGAERVLLETCRHLLPLGVAIDVAVLQERPGPSLVPAFADLHVAVRHLGVRRLLDVAGHRQVRTVIADLRPDIVHTHLELADVHGTIAARRLGIPSVSTLHTLDAPPRRSRQAARLALRTRVLRRYASRIIAVSHSVRGHYLAAGRLSPARTVTVYNGVDLDRYRVQGTASSLDVRRELALPAAVQVLMAVAVQRPAKGLDRLLAALPMVRRRHPHAVVVLVGDGPARPSLEAEARRLGVADAVRFVGRRDDIPRLLAAADVFVVPSLTDALPTALAEAMASALPVVATSVGGIPEMVEDRRTGFLVPPDNAEALAHALVAVLDDPSQGRAMGRAGRDVARARFDVRACSARLLEEYRAVRAGRDPKVTE